MIFFLLREKASRRKFVTQISFIVLVVSRILLTVEDFFFKGWKFIYDHDGIRDDNIILLKIMRG